MQGVHDLPSRRRTYVATAVLASILLVGSAVGFHPDFDVTFGIEAWRRFGLPAAACGSAVLVAVVASTRLADSIATACERLTTSIPRPARTPVLLAAALAMFLLLPDASLSGDAMAAPRDIVEGSVQPSNALTSWLHLAVRAAFRLDPVECARVVSYAAGVAGVLFAVLLAKELFADGPRRTAATVLLLTTANAALFFGSIEDYVPLGAAMMAYLLTSVRAIRGVGNAWLPPLVLGVAFALHGSAGLLLPSMLYLAWRPDGADPGVARRALRVVRSGLLFLCPVAAAFALLVAWTWHGTLPVAGPLLWGNFLGAQGYGPVVALQLGPADVGPQYALLSGEHALASLTTIFLAAPAAWALLAAIALVRTADARLAPRDRSLAAFGWIALVPWVSYPLVWNVSYPLRRDWDLFSPLGILASFVAGILVLRAPRDRLATVRVTALCLFAFAPFVVSNAGDFKDRRAFAQSAAAALDAPPRGARSIVERSMSTFVDGMRRPAVGT